jgi:hypothetical protein
MRVSALIAAAILAIGAARAAEHSDNPPPAATEMIAVDKAMDMLGALTLVTGEHEVIVGQGASQHVAKVPYELSADTFWALKDDISALRMTVTASQETIQNMKAQAEAKDGSPLPPPAERELEEQGEAISEQREAGQQTLPYPPRRSQGRRESLSRRDHLLARSDHRPLRCRVGA